MTVKEGELEGKEIRLSEITLLRICLKSSNGKLYIDVRKWFKYPNLDDYVPSKKGLMLELSEWKESIEYISKMIDDNSK